MNPRGTVGWLIDGTVGRLMVRWSVIFFHIINQGGWGKLHFQALIGELVLMCSIIEKKPFWLNSVIIIYLQIAIDKANYHTGRIDRLLFPSVRPFVCPNLRYDSLLVKLPSLHGALVQEWFRRGLRGAGVWPVPPQPEVCHYANWTRVCRWWQLRDTITIAVTKRADVTMRRYLILFSQRILRYELFNSEQLYSAQIWIMNN